MSEFRGTPGPWGLSSAYTARISGNRIDGEGWFVADCDNELLECTDEDAANARLIAAAPDLLEACIAFMSRYQNHMVNADLLFSDVAQQSRAAIAKALGQPQ